MVKSCLGFILTVGLLLSSFGYVITRLQDPQFVVESARSVNLYGRLLGNSGVFVPEQQKRQLGLDDSAVAEVLKIGINGEQFYDLLGQIASAYLPWFSGQQDGLTFRYDLGAIKQTITSALLEKILAGYGNLPLCAATQLRSWSFEEGLPSCQLRAGTLSAKSIANQAGAVAEKITADLPDSFNAPAPSNALVSTKDKLKLLLGGINIVWTVTGLVLLSFLLLFRLRGFITLATSFFMVGLLQITFSLVGWDWILRTTNDFVGGSGEIKAIAPIVIDLFSVIVAASKTVLGNISIGFLVAGGVLLVVGIIGRVHQPKVITKVG